MVENYDQLPFQDELGMFGGLTIYLRQKPSPKDGIVHNVEGF
jgi:hypothetical protein